MREEKMRLEKPKHRKGLWSPEEDEKLRGYVLRHGHGSWSSVPTEIGLQRNGKSCRLRWINYLRPGIKRGTFSANEEDKIFSLHRDLGNKWSQIAQQLPGRTDNEIKNHWHTHMRKRSRQAILKADSQGFGSNIICVSSSNGSFHNSSMYSSGSNNGLLKEVLPGPEPKVFFEEWLWCNKLNPFGYQLTNVFDTNNDQFSRLDEGSLDYELGGGWVDGVMPVPDYLGVDQRISCEFSTVESSSDLELFDGLNQVYATNDVQYSWES